MISGVLQTLEQNIEIFALFQEKHLTVENSSQDPAPVKV